MIRHSNRSLRGTVHVPGDKSIAHRALILGAIASGNQRIHGLPASSDIASTVSCLERLGVRVHRDRDGATLETCPFPGEVALDAGNSGTTARLLAGLLAGFPVRATIDGDASLRRRPMRRVSEPLVAMGADVRTSPDGTLPMSIAGSNRLRGMTHRPTVASAQVKSAVLLAGLRAEGCTRVLEALPTRDHTERMLSAMGIPVRCENNGAIALDGGKEPKAIDVLIPGDISSAAFFVVAATCLPGSAIQLPGVGVNPTRTGALELLREMGAKIEYVNERKSGGEPVADVRVESATLKGRNVEPRLVPTLIDELPVLAVAATQAIGETVVAGAAELRHKESDRIAAVVRNLSAMGAQITERPDGFIVRGPTPLHGARVGTYGDHRIAMAMGVAVLLAEGESLIESREVVAVSYPGFFEALEAVTTTSKA